MTLVPVVPPFVGRLKALGKRTIERFANAKINWISKAEGGGGSLNVAQRLGEMTASLAAAASLVLSIMVLSLALTLLAKFSKLVSDQCESLLSFKNLRTGVKVLTA